MWTDFTGAVFQKAYDRWAAFGMELADGMMTNRPSLPPANSMKRWRTTAGRLPPPTSTSAPTRAAAAGLPCAEKAT
jgi:hypothetical protein